MAPFKFAGRATVVPAKSDIRLELFHPKPCVLVGDGQEETLLDGNEKLHFTVSDEKARFISFGRRFYTRARMKLMDGIC
jgi:NAD kinase